ncbi:hypothetical protein V5O48_007644 [Marasmius crinis-equi]|uniref:histidine kinase n=1 Tax=Marasmius crinis-equi TaxID=585013 RepID=A0ABR3FG20_9AGAR
MKSIWFNFTRRLHADVPIHSTTNTAPEGDYDQQNDYEEEWKENTDAGRTEKVVVEQTWATREGRIGKSSESSDPEPAALEVKSGATPPSAALFHTVQDRESAVTGHGFWGRSHLLVRLRYRLWPTVVEFFYPRPFEGPSEDQFRNEDWQSKKMLALVASIWFCVSWAIGLIVVQRPLTLLDKIAYYGLGPAFSFPIPLMVMYDFPRSGKWFYQLYLSAAVWIWAFEIVLVMYTCGTYNSKHRIFDCPQSRDFIGLFYYTTAYPTIAIFALKMNRLTACMGVIAFLVVSSALMIPDRSSWIRSMLNFVVFHAVLLYVHNIIEKNERRMFSLRLQVKVQWKATQRAQINERKTAESKYRLTSYVFHEVRVPLNAALLAVQNIEASGTVSKEVDIEFEALMGSLRMMSQVLNDVLDFNKMDGGQFELVNRPYVFHQTMRSMFMTLQLTTEARNLNLITNLDPSIDLVARRAAYQAMDEREDAIARHLRDHPDVEGVVIGDEARFRQIVTNLASNACKFTPEGGTVSITTRLILPSIGPDGIPDHNDRKDSMAAQLSASRLAQHNINNHSRDGCNGTSPPTILVRIEVSDTGCGIDQSELKRGKLFSAFNQTEKGRQQGGKGTGLGLALVKNIVKLSGGRLGVSSEVGKGSTFWVELPLGVGRQALIPSGSDVNFDFDSDGSGSGSDLAKIRTAARHNVVPEALSQHDTLPMAVDAAALSASELSAMAKPNALTHSALMEQGGNIDLVLHRQDSPSLGSLAMSKISGTSPVPTPATEKSDGMSRLAEHAPRSPPESPIRDIHDIEIENPPETNNDSSALGPSEPNPQTESERPGSATTNGRPNFIALPNSHLSSSSSGSSRTTTKGSPMALFDRSFDRTNSSNSQTQVEIDPGLPVLVVDDDGVTRMMLKRMLQRLGCEVCTAENGEIALRKIMEDQFSPSITKVVSFERGTGGGYMYEEPPDPGEGEPGGGDPSDSSGSILQAPLSKFAVVFLDNQMPTLSGLRTVEILRRERGKRDYVCGLTGNALLPDQEEYLNAGVDVVLTKPVSESSIKNILKQADLRRKRHMRTSAIS